MWITVFYLSTPHKKKKSNPYDEIRIVKPIPAPAKPAAPPQIKFQKPQKPQKPGINPDTLKAMHLQADAERAIADALERKAQREKDPVKKARLVKQIANSNLRFNNILDKIDKLTQ